MLYYTQGTPISLSFCFFFFFHLNFKLKFGKRKKKICPFFWLFPNDRANVLCQRWIAHVSQKQLTASFLLPFCLLGVLVCSSFFWNRAHLTPHSYSLLVDINNRPTLYFSFLLLLFSFPSLVWGSHVVSLLFFPPSRPTSDAELTTMNRYIFLSVFIDIYNTLLLVRQTGTIGPHLLLLLTYTSLLHPAASATLSGVPYNKPVTLTRSDITRRGLVKIISRLFQSINIRHVPLSLFSERCSFPRACVFPHLI